MQVRKIDLFIIFVFLFSLISCNKDSYVQPHDRVDRCQIITEPKHHGPPQIFWDTLNHTLDQFGRLFIREVRNQQFHEYDSLVYLMDRLHKVYRIIRTNEEREILSISGYDYTLDGKLLKLSVSSESPHLELREVVVDSLIYDSERISQLDRYKIRINLFNDSLIFKSLYEQVNFNYDEDGNLECQKTERNFLNTIGEVVGKLKYRSEFDGYTDLMNPYYGEQVPDYLVDGFRKFLHSSRSEFIEDNFKSRLTQDYSSIEINSNNYPLLFGYFYNCN